MQRRHEVGYATAFLDPTVVRHDTADDRQVAAIHVEDAATDAACAQIQSDLETAGLSVLYDDRDERPGAKFATADLIGLPWQVIVGPRGVAAGTVEL